MPVEVSIQRRPPGIHDDVVKDGIAIIRSELDLAGLDGIFSARPNRQLNLKGNQRVRLGIYSIEQRHVTIKIKPGRNDTAWEWVIYPPRELRPETVHKLLSMTGRLNEPKELIPTTKPRFDEKPPDAEHTPEEKPTMPEAKEQLPATNGNGHVKTVEESTGLGLQELAMALGKAAKSREAYKEREEKLIKAKAELEEAELMLMAAQETHEKAKKLHDRLRTEHAADVKGRTSMEILTQFKSIVG